MSSDPLNLYKLIVLYMLHQVDFPLTRVQIFDYVLEKGYTNYFTLQKAIAELIDAELVLSKINRNNTQLSLSEDGETTLSYFENRIPDAIKEEIDQFFVEKELEIRNDISAKGDFFKSSGKDYTVQLSLKNGNDPLVELSLTAPSEDVARAMCDAWKKKNQDIYSYLMKELL